MMRRRALRYSCCLVPVWLLGIQTFVLGGALVYAVKQVGVARRANEQTRQAHEDATRPWVIVDIVPMRVHIMNLLIANIGTSAARDVRLTFDPPLASAVWDRGGDQIADLPALSEPIPLLAPGRRLAIFYDSGPDRKDKGLPDEHVVTASYADSSGKHYDDPPFTVSIRVLMDTPTVGVKDMHDLVRSVEKMEAHVKRLTNASLRAERRQVETASRAAPEVDPPSD